MRERRFVPRTAAAGVALTLALGFPGCKVDFGSPHKVTNSEKAYVNPFALPPIEVHLYNPKNLWWQSCTLPIPYRKALTAALDQPIVQLAARTGAINAF